jgi:uncharacterized protein YbjT (DUF2867 family)
MILVTGATGNVGSELVRLLAGAGEPVRALCRSPEKAGSVGGRGVEPVLGDLGDPGSVEAAMEGCDRLFLLTSPAPDQVRREKAAIDAARRASVRRVVRVSAADANPGAPVPWARWHSAIDAHLRASGLEWTILKPTAFMQNFLSWTAMIARGRLYGAAGEGRASWVDARDVAAVAASALAEVDSVHEGATYFLTGPEAFSMRGATAVLSEVLGREVRYVNVPRLALRARLRLAGLPGWFADGIAGQFADVLAGGHALDVTGEVIRTTGRPPRAFADFARDHRRVFGSAARSKERGESDEQHGPGKLSGRADEVARQAAEGAVREAQGEQGDGRRDDERR